MAFPLTNKLWWWRDRVLYLGDSLDPQMHSHHAVQCCIALGGTLRVQGPDVEEWQSCQTAVIAANVPHRITNLGGPVCLLYLEKTSNSIRSIMDYRRVAGESTRPAAPLVSPTPASTTLCEAAIKAMAKDVGQDYADELLRTCLDVFHGQISEPQPLDPRIALLLNNVHTQPGRLFTGQELADIVCLSQSRMQHLFKQQMGIPIRRYLLWARLRRVMELAIGGQSLTAASHDSGFSDSAHFTRTFHAMFGIAPSTLLANKTGLISRLCERPPC
jgi:AraC-like DNA-binding protein